MQWVLPQLLFWNQRHRFQTYQRGLATAFRVNRVVLCWLLCWTGIGPLPTLQAESFTQEDAPLYALHFIDLYEGWAIGAEGTIWHTMDAGLTWELQPSGSQATLTGLHLTNHRPAWTTGYVVGRQSVPCNPGSTGVVLYTRDNGQRWFPASDDKAFPGLRQVRFFDDQRGLILGEANPLHPASVLWTIDGARTWHPLDLPPTAGWLACLFPADANEGYLVGRAGQFARVLEGRGRPQTGSWLPGTAIRDLARSASHRLWAVGERGQIKFSDDHGQTWQDAQLNLPPEILAVWDFYAVTAVGKHIWAGGRPGSIILHSPDDGQTWQPQFTSRATPLYDIHFVDEQHGWAVGELGTILYSGDGGDHWAIQRTGGQRSALMWVDGDGQHLPLAVVARLGAELGLHQTVVTFCPTADPNRVTDPDQAARLLECFRAAGGTALDWRARFPLPTLAADSTIAHLSDEQVVAFWNRQLDGQALTELERELVLAIRMWQPQTVISALADATDNPAASPCFAHPLIQTLRTACEKAADPTQYPEHAEFFNLSPHLVERGFIRAVPSDPNNKSEEQAAPLTYGSMELSNRQGESFREIANRAATLLVRPALQEPTDQFRLLFNRTQRNPNPRILHSGISAIPRDNARSFTNRTVAEPDPMLVQRQQYRQNLESIALHLPEPMAPEQFLAYLGKETEHLEPRFGGTILFTLGQQYIRAGKIDLAQATFESLMQRYPEHPLTLEASRWCIGYLTSSECRQRAPHGAIITYYTRRNQPVRREQTNPSETKSANTINGDLNETVYEQVVDSPRKQEEWNGAAIIIGRRLQVAAPPFWADPSIQVALAAATRRIGQSQGVGPIFQNVLGSNPPPAWRTVIEQEQFLLFANEVRPPRPMLTSAPVEQKPKLDGQINEAFWHTGPVVELSVAPDELDLVANKPTAATRVWFRHDQQHLYLAADCPLVDPSQLVTVEPRKSRDLPATWQRDRVEICLDLDRDYMSYYRLIIDQAGQVWDDCWGDVSWNPNWFVAVASDTQSWRFEAAIPLNQLAEQQQLLDSVWAGNVIRITPQQPLQSYSHPAGLQPRPEGFTLFKFLRPSNFRRTAN